ncbi:hypothetical protein ABMK89_17360 [Mycobacteroides abscessus subsp. massiliense]
MPQPTRACDIRKDGRRELGVVAGEIINPDALVGIPGVMGVESARPMPAPRMVRRPDGGR